jgi:hypothetical protein
MLAPFKVQKPVISAPPMSVDDTENESEDSAPPTSLEDSEQIGEL